MGLPWTHSHCRMSSGVQTGLRKKGLGTMLEVLPELQ